MKILAVNWRDLKNPDAGGAEVHLHEIMKRMAERGHEVDYVASNFEGGTERDTYDGMTIHRRGRWYNANFVLPVFIKKFLRENHVDLIVEDINKIPFFLPAVADRRVLAVVPHLFGTSVFRETNLLFASYVYMWERFIPFVYQSCNFTVISPSTKDDLIERGIPKNRIDVVYCGLDHSTYRRIDGMPRFDEPTVIHFGRIRKYKSIDIAVQAFALVKKKLANAKMLIIGDGPDRKNLAGTVRKMGLDGSVEFLGEVPVQTLVELLNRSHLFINASTKEGWGLTVLEANACGMPVLASNRPGLKDSVKDGESGFLLEYGDVRGFAEKSFDILTNHDLWNRMSASALAWSRQFTWEKTADDMERIFEREVS